MIFNTTFSWNESERSLLCVENHVLILKFHFDTNKPFDSCWKTRWMQRITMFTFETDLENPVFHSTLVFHCHHIFFNFFSIILNTSTGCCHHFYTGVWSWISSLVDRGSVENHAEEVKNYDDGNEISDWCRLTSCTRWITTLTFATDLQNPVTMPLVRNMYHCVFSFVL